MLFSIIMPAYNAARFLEKSIRSVLGQTYQNWELILINDGSQDDTDKIAQEYAAAEPRIRYFRQENQGVSATRNKGIELAAGEYVFFMDSDDEIDCQMLRKLHRVLENEACDVVTFNAYWTDVDLNITGRFTEPFSQQALKLQTEDEKRIIYSVLASDQTFGLPWLFVVRRGVISSIRYRTDMILCEDLLFAIQVYESAGSIICLPDYFYYYRDNPAGCVRNFKFQKLEDLKIAHAAKVALAERKHLQENINIVDTWFCLSVISFYISFLENRQLCTEYLARVKNDAFVMQMFAKLKSWPKTYPPLKLLMGNAAQRAVIRSGYLLRWKAGRLLRKLKKAVQ